MPSADFDRSRTELTEGQSGVHCDACQSVLQDGGQQAISFLLLDQLTIPLLSCDEHVAQFISVCGLTSDDTADLLHHRPAGGIRCPGCRHASYTPSHPMVPVQDGAVVVLGCPDHQSEIITRFHAGLQTHHQLTSPLDTSTGPSL